MIPDLPTGWLLLIALAAYTGALWLGLRGFNRLVPAEAWEFD